MLEHCAVAVVSLGAREVRGEVARAATAAWRRACACPWWTPRARGTPSPRASSPPTSRAPGSRRARAAGARWGRRWCRCSGPSSRRACGANSRARPGGSCRGVTRWSTRRDPGPTGGRDDPGLEGPKYNIHRTCILSIVDRHTFTFVQLISADPTICTGFSAPTSVMPRDCPPITAPASARARLARAWISRGKSAARGAPARVRDVAFRALVRARFALALALLSFATSCAGASGWRAAEHKLREQGLLHDVSPGAVTFRADAPGDDAPPPRPSASRGGEGPRGARDPRGPGPARAPARAPRAVRMLREALELDATKREALALLGRAHQLGEGAEMDERLAVSYFERAAELGDPDAHEELALAYSLGWVRLSSRTSRDARDARDARETLDALATPIASRSFGSSFPRPPLSIASSAIRLRPPSERRARPPEPPHPHPRAGRPSPATPPRDGAPVLRRPRRLPARRWPSRIAT